MLVGGLQENRESIADSSHSSAPPEHSHSHLASVSNSNAEREVHTIGDSPARTNISFPSYSVSVLSWSFPPLISVFPISQTRISRIYPLPGFFVLPFF